jgi:rhodanese-related sulfurtransferase
MIYFFIGLLFTFLIYRVYIVQQSKKKILDMIKNKQNVTLVDVRNPDEVAVVAVDGALNIPLGQLKARASELDKNTPIAVFCASGMRSASAAQTLKSLGFTQVTNLGTWRNAQAVQTGV